MSAPRYAIAEYSKFKLNYWPIPKCANTAVKTCLSFPNGSQGNPYSKFKWVHKPENVPNLDINIALSNGNLNFTVTRHPYDRVISLYKDFGLRRPWKMFKVKPTIDYFVQTIYDGWPTDDATKNYHAYSMCYYVTKDNKLLVDRIIDVNDLNKFLKSINVNPRIVNKTTTMNIPLSDKIKEIIYNRYSNDFKVFGYTP